MWNSSASSSLLLRIGDDYGKCEASHTCSSSSATTVGFEKILMGEYDLHHTLGFSSPVQTSPAVFSTSTSKRNLGNVGDGMICTGETCKPAFAQFVCNQPTIASGLEKWMTAGEPTCSDGGSLRGSKRLRTMTAAMPQHGLQHGGMARKQPVKAPCRRSHKLGDKITALQQLVSPYGKTDTASVLHEAATCIRLLHEQIQILTAPYPGINSSACQQDTGDETTDLRRRGLCLAPMSPAIVSLISETARDHRVMDVADQRSWFGGV